jgi:pSer/pThr/pTyr-binding forkhead associated (FHA) protein
MDEKKLYSLMITSSGGSQRHDVSKSSVVLGRSGQADVRIDSNGLSRSHAELKFEDGKFHIKDLGSLNGTYLKGQKIESQIWVEVAVCLAFIL